MTMPKFEPVAWLFKGLKPGYRTEFASIDPCESQTWPTDNGMVWNKSELYTSDQLTEAYEAGKREASEDLEQAAFEKWLYDKCPPGDVESVQRQWLESYEYAELAWKMEQAAQINHLQMALADTEALEAETSARCLKQAAQIEMMREALEFMWRDVPMNDYAFEKCEKALSTTPDQALEQFAAKVRDQCANLCDDSAKSLSACPKSAQNDAAISAIENNATRIRTLTGVTLEDLK